ncbi:hypothetical protein LguiA_024856 [Lonicera macranthoides]
MPHHFSVHLFFLITLITTNLHLTSTTGSPPPHHHHHPPPPASTNQSQQLNNIIDALIGTGDFANWAYFLSITNRSNLPLTATLFIPANSAISQLLTPTASGLNFDPYIIPYHIVPRHLSFFDLRRFKTHSRLPTLLPYRTLIIMNNSLDNFTIDNSTITHPDLYVTSSICVHGIANLLDYSIYGDDQSSVPAPPEAVPPPLFYPGEVISGGRSDAACLCTEFPIGISVLWVVFVFKIYRNPLSR